MRIAIFFALDDEFLPFRNLARQRASEVRLLTAGRFAQRLGLTFQVGEKTVIVATTGSGARNAGEWARAAAFTDCAWFLAAGVAGGISPNLDTGDVVLAAHVYLRQPGEFELVHSARGAAGSVTGARSGDLVTVPHVLITQQDKAQLYASFDHDGRRADTMLADMESAAIAQAAREQGARFAAIRAVSDTAGEDLPLDFNQYLDARGNVNRGRIAREALTRPVLFRQLTRLGRNTKVACVRLAEVVWQWIEQVP